MNTKIPFLIMFVILLVKPAEAQDSLKKQAPLEFTVPALFKTSGPKLNVYPASQATVVKSMQFQVFNRWGEFVFRSADAYPSWDGKISDGKQKGKLAGEGVYYYSIKATLGDGREVEQTGYINVMP